MLTVGDLFSGIGGFSLGLERAGMRTLWFAETDPYASAVLRKHWPDVPNHGDVRGIRAGTVEPVDVLCGGFPCQDISNAGKREGIDGERSGLWSEFARIIGELRPRYVIVENVSALLGRGIERVLGDLAALGFDAEWHCIPASAVGAPHIRDRVWIVAYASGDALRNGEQRRPWRRSRELSPCGQAVARHDGAQGIVADSYQWRCEGERLAQHYRQQSTSGREPDRCGARGCGDWAHVADADELARQEGRARNGSQRVGRWDADRCAIGADVPDADEQSLGRVAISWRECGQWAVEPDVGRVADGVPSRVDRLRCLGNAIVPQIAEIIGRAIVSASE